MNNTSEFTSILKNSTPSKMVSKDSQKIISKLSEDDRDKAITLSHKLDSYQANDVLAFGAETQQNLGEFSVEIIDKVSNNELGDIGDSLTSLMVELKSTNPDSLSKPKTFFGKLFNKTKNSIAQTTAGYQKASQTISLIKKDLEKRKDELLADSKSLDSLYNKNLEYFNELNLHIAAGQYKLDELDNVSIPELTKKAESSNDQMVVQELNDLTNFRARLEKRVHDLIIARQISIQQAPQIRLIQTTNITLAEKIQSSIFTAIPLWENQAAIAIALLRQKNTLDSQKLVSDSTNDLLAKNSEMLKIAAIETARENERGIVDVETLKLTQNNLIETISETIKIQEEGAKNRALAEKELQVLEVDLKNKLLETIDK